MNEFLKKNTQVREDILNLKLFFDLKEASAYSNVHLKIFKSDVDIDGFDIIIDDNDFSLIKCQLKSRFESKTQYFDIHRIMLKPNLYIHESFDFIEPNGCPLDNRGVILIDGTIVDNKIETRYYYLDVYLLRAMEIGIFKLRPNSKVKAGEILTSLRNADLKEKIKVIHSLFLPLSDANSLLALMGFNAKKNINIKNYIGEISKIIKNTKMERSEKISHLQGYWDNVHEELDVICNQKEKLKKCELTESTLDC